MTDPRSEARARIIEAMREDPFMDDIRFLGTTTQDQRMAHYADIALAAFAEPAAAMPAREDTVAFVQKWMMSGDHAPDQWHRDFAAAIDARALANRSVEALQLIRGMLTGYAGQPNFYGDLFKIADSALTAAAAMPGPPSREGPGRYLADRFQWAAPGDQQEDAWIVRFCDNDVRDMIFTGPEAEQEAWAAWERHAPGYNIYVFRLATLTPSHSGETGEVERLREALLGLEQACEQLAATRPHEVYLAMIDGGQAEALLSLDARRQAARAALKTSPDDGGLS